MQNRKPSIGTLIGLCFLLFGIIGDNAIAFERTEERETCTVSEPLRQPFFGDLHVHSSYSFDSYISSQRNDPWDAYRYAKGETLLLPDEDGNPTVEAQIQRPLDFAAVTDHAEFLGQINVCTIDPWKLGYWWPHCIMTRASHYWTQLLAASWWVSLGVSSADESGKSFACTLSDCDVASVETWQRIQNAAEEHYDRSSECRFTTFVGYEYTDAPDSFNMHRNVIFRNAEITPRAISTYETGSGNIPRLWQLLREECIDQDTSCDVLAIPHNPNLSGGLMFQNPANLAEAQDRIALEPLVELVQHKAASECRFDRVAGRGVGTEDELCDFEQVVTDNLTMLGSVHGEVLAPEAAPVPVEAFARRNMVRNVLKDGLAIEREQGTNPFVMGFVGSTDTHSATPGAAEEDNYTGHLGRRDSGYRNVQDHFFSNPGGHAVVWAEENSRDAIFEGMRRRETYATSGTRPIVRFFAGPDLPKNLCSSARMIEQADQLGVPMGGHLRGDGTGRAPRFWVNALKDPGIPGHPGTDLQRIQIIKGWIDASGETHEQVFDVAGDANNGASVDPNTCNPTGAGAAQLCSVWQDPQFDPNQSAFYYVRVLENPTCRWSTLQCQSAGVNPFADNCSESADAATARAQARGAKGDVYEKCCIDPAAEPFYTPVIQERAWTSPIWVEPAARSPESIDETRMGSTDPADPLQSAMGELVLSLQAVEEDIRQSPAFGDEQERIGGYRHVLRALAKGLEAEVRQDPDYPYFRILDWWLREGGDNPDQRYAFSPIRGGEAYRVWGDLGSATRFELQIYAGRPWDGTGKSAGYLTFEEIDLNDDGTFEVWVTPEKQEGNWLHNPPESTTLFARHIYADWSDAPTGDIHIDRVGFEGQRRPPETEKELAEKIRAATVMFGTTARNWPAFVQRRYVGGGPKNTVRPPLDTYAFGGVRGRWMSGGYFELGDGEALLIRIPPTSAHYQGIQLADMWMASLEHGN